MHLQMLPCRVQHLEVQAGCPRDEHLVPQLSHALMALRLSCRA